MIEGPALVTASSARTSAPSIVSFSMPKQRVGVAVRVRHYVVVGRTDAGDRQIGVVLRIDDGVDISTAIDAIRSATA